MPKFAALLGAAGLLWPGAQAEAFTIELTPSANLLMNPEALAGFQRAAREWESLITNNVTVYVSVDYSGTGFGPGVLGFTSYGTDDPDPNFTYNLDYATVRNAMAARSTRPGDGILAYLPTSAQVQASVPSGALFDKTTLGLLRANQRVLGLLPASNHYFDGLIAFSSNYSWDFDRSDGISWGTYDFQTAAVHEIGHLLGFTSDVDDFDNDPTTPSDNLTTLDLFRFPSDHQPLTMSEFTNFARVLTPGTPSAFSDTQVHYEMSTGANNGDFAQASHWKDDGAYSFTFDESELIGIMDPSLPDGVTENLKASDLRAFELIGYDVVPEPASAALLLLGGAVLGARRRR